MKQHLFVSRGQGGAGFTLLEAIIGFALLTGTLLTIGLFVYTLSSVGTFFGLRFETKQEILQTFKVMTPEIHAMSQSELGSYPIAAASSTTITFYSDLDGDGLSEEVRYFLEGTTFKKGVIHPSGNPIQYNPAAERTTELVHNMITTQPVFTYYDANFTGTEPPLSAPIVISNIRVTQIEINARTPGASTTTLMIRLTPRNLRTNL